MHSLVYFAALRERVNILDLAKGMLRVICESELLRFRLLRENFHITTFWLIKSFCQVMASVYVIGCRITGSQLMLAIRRWIFLAQCLCKLTRRLGLLC